MFLTATSGSDGNVPEVFVEYKLCEKFGCLPSQLEAEDAHKLDLFLAIINLEAKASRLNRARQKHYKK